MSKATLAVCYQAQSQLVQLDVANTPAGFRQLVRRCGTQCLYILEATGPYHLAAPTYLVAVGAEVAVVNPLVVRRFIQMHLGKGKSDRKDAQWLLRFGQQQPVARWQPPHAVLVECRQLEQALELLIRQQTRSSNALDAIQHQPVVSAVARRELQQTVATSNSRSPSWKPHYWPRWKRITPANCPCCAPFRVSGARRRPHCAC